MRNVEGVDYLMVVVNFMRCKITEILHLAFDYCFCSKAVATEVRLFPATRIGCSLAET